MDVNDLTDLMKSRAVTFSFQNRSCFTINCGVVWPGTTGPYDFEANGVDEPSATVRPRAHPSPLWSPQPCFNRHTQQHRSATLTRARAPWHTHLHL